MVKLVPTITESSVVLEPKIVKVGDDDFVRAVAWEVRQGKPLSVVRKDYGSKVQAAVFDADQKISIELQTRNVWRRRVR